MVPDRAGPDPVRQAAPATTQLHPGAGPNGHRTRAPSPCCGGRLGPSASPSTSPRRPPTAQRPTAPLRDPAAPLPARVPSRPQRQQRQPPSSLAGSLGLRRRQENSHPLAKSQAPPSAKAPPIGPNSTTATAPHAGHVDYPTARRSANQRASADPWWGEGGALVNMRAGLAARGESA